MAKTKTKTTAENSEASELARAAPQSIPGLSPAEKPDAEANKPRRLLHVDIQIPLGELPEHGHELNKARGGKINLGDGRRHVQAQLASFDAEMLLMIRQGLRQANAKLEDEKPVVSNADALRWLLRKCREAMTAEG